MPAFDVVGVGLNATDTVILLPRFPAYAEKLAFEHEVMSPGGQVTGAMLACARLGLRAKYIGTLGDDERGRIQLESLRGSGINIDHVLVRKGCPNQSAYILIDQATGERTILWRRPECLRLDPSEITPELITSARLLHIDGHDTPAVGRAARLARQASIPVTLDVDSINPGFDSVLPHVDYLIGNTGFPERWTGVKDPFQALEKIRREYGMRVAASTLGPFGALALGAEGFVYSPGFLVNCVDTTGAGDIFHGAFCYAVLKNMPLREALDFSNAMAALNCTALGARGGIAREDEARELMRQPNRRTHPDYTSRAAG